MEAGLLEIVRSINRSWIYDTYSSLYRAIHPGGMSGYCIPYPVEGKGIRVLYSDPSQPLFHLNGCHAI